MKIETKNQTILRLPDVKARTGLSRSTIYALIQAKKLKAPVRLGPRSVGWLESDVNEFIAECIKASSSSREMGEM